MIGVVGNELIARRFFEAWNGHLEVIDELAARELEVRYPALGRTVYGRDAYKRLHADIRRRFPDLELTPDEPIVGSSHVVIEWMGSSTHLTRLFGVEPTGKRMQWSGVSIYRIQAGKVVEERGQEDMLTVLRQIGALHQASTERA
jgi:steroid delta-isomerase-like uncharacterized protein